MLSNPVYVFEKGSKNGHLMKLALLSIWTLISIPRKEIEWSHVSRIAKEFPKFYDLNFLNILLTGTGAKQ